MRSEKGFTLIELLVMILLTSVFLLVLVMSGILIYNCGAGHDCEEHNHNQSGEVE